MQMHMHMHMHMQMQMHMHMHMHIHMHMHMHMHIHIQTAHAPHVLRTHCMNAHRMHTAVHTAGHQTPPEVVPGDNEAEPLAGLAPRVQCSSCEPSEGNVVEREPKPYPNNPNPNPNPNPNQAARVREAAAQEAAEAEVEGAVLRQRQQLAFERHMSTLGHNVH